jgi:hypothetical protein
MNNFRALLACLVLAFFAGAAPAQIAPVAPARGFDTARVSTGAGSVDIPYLVTLPPGHAPGKPAPVLVYFTGARPDEPSVLKELAFWREEAARRGWVLAGIAAPRSGSTLTSLSGQAWNAVLDEITRVAPPQNGFYVTGVEGGGTAALYLAAMASQRVRSVLVRPGGAEEWFMGMVADNLKNTPVTFLVGENDGEYLRATEATVAILQEAGSMRAFQVLYRGEGRPVSATAADVMNMLERTGRGESPVPPPAPKQPKADAETQDRLAIARVLDALHEAAAKAQEERYFSLFAPDAVFLGTDPKERWTLEEFRAFAHPYFKRGKAWTYEPVQDERHIAIEGAGRDVAWFDEKLYNEKLGFCRGSGALVKIDGAWKIRQYNLTMLIPNAIAEDVAKQAREGGEP